MGAMDAKAALAANMASKKGPSKPTPKPAPKGKGKGEDLSWTQKQIFKKYGRNYDQIPVGSKKWNQMANDPLMGE